MNKNNITLMAETVCRQVSHKPSSENLDKTTSHTLNKLTQQALKSNKSVVVFNVYSNAIMYRVKGKNARTLLNLIHAGHKGITSLEMSSWALRLSAYIHVLRHKHGLAIRVTKEAHEDGWHARYHLESSIQIIAIH